MKCLYSGLQDSSASFVLALNDHWSIHPPAVLQLVNVVSSLLQIASAEDEVVEEAVCHR